MTVHDLTHALRPGIPRYPGDPEVRVEPWPDEPPWHVSAFGLGSHSGTHLDAPLHRVPGAPGIGDLSPDRFVGLGVVLDASGRGENERLPASVADALPPVFRPGWFVLLRTGWDRFWGDDAYFRHPCLSPALAERLRAAGAGIVGIDALNVDSTVDGEGVVHDILLGNGVLLAENLARLDRLPTGTPMQFAFAPLGWGSNVDGSPIRALAWRPDAFRESAI